MIPGGSSTFGSSAGALQGSCGGAAKMAFSLSGGSSALGSSAGASQGSGGDPSALCTESASWVGCGAMGDREDDDEGSFGGDSVRRGWEAIGGVVGCGEANDMRGGGRDLCEKSGGGRSGGMRCGGRIAGGEAGCGTEGSGKGGC